MKIEGSLIYLGFAQRLSTTAWLRTAFQAMSSVCFLHGFKLKIPNSAGILSLYVVSSAMHVLYARCARSIHAVFSC